VKVPGGRSQLDAGEERRQHLDRWLQRARRGGFLGPGPVEQQVAHALGFRRAWTRARERHGNAVAAGRSHTEHTPAAPVADAGVAAARRRRCWTGLDLGSGGGMPGLVLLANPPAGTVVRGGEDERELWTLLDANRRRTEFLREALRELGVADRGRVLEGRAEELAHQLDQRGCYDVVVARGFGPPMVTAECGAPFLRSGGWLVVSEPPCTSERDPADGDGDPAGRWPREVLERLGLRDRGVVASEFSYRILQLVRPVPVGYPRRTGVPRKRPLR
jgi:16S rRNA (guanine527-N7)-methyltransferase